MGVILAAFPDMLFSERSVWTMIHGIGLGGAALVGLGAALFYLAATRPGHAGAPGGTSSAPPAFTGLLTLTALVLWLTVIVGTYIIFPPYRATPPSGTADLSAFPRAMILADDGTAWLHAFAMESKEHMPWIASMLATAVAFAVARHRRTVLHDGWLRQMSIGLLAVAFALVAFVSLLGVFVNKVAPLQ